MNVRGALREGTRLLTGIGSDEAELEAELLLQHALQLDRVSLYRGLADPITREQEFVFRHLLDRRANHEPTAYILGHKEFFGRAFEVTRTALIPRPETETLVELVLAFVGQRIPDVRATIADIGVGCGTIAVTVASELRHTTIIATDTSADALELARRNAERHGVAGRIRFVRGHLLDAIDSPVQIIAANLPYVRTEDWRALPPEIREHEPRGALDGGEDGLDLISELLRAAPDHVADGGAIFIEIGDDQGEDALRLGQNAFPGGRSRVEKDLAGRDRVLVIEL